MTSHQIIQQFHYEVCGWQRLLSYLKQENVHCKNRLAEIVTGDMDNEILERIENFQAEFLSHDEALQFFTKEIARQFKLLDQFEKGDVLNLPLLTRYQEKLHKDLMNEQQVFSRIKEDFDRFLSGDLQVMSG